MASARLSNQRSPKVFLGPIQPKSVKVGTHWKSPNGRNNNEASSLRNSSNTITNPVLLYKSQDYQSLAEKSKTNQEFFSAKKKIFLNEIEKTQKSHSHHQIKELHDIQIAKDFDEEAIRNMDMNNFANFVILSRQNKNPLSDAVSREDIKSPNRAQTDKDNKEAQKNKKIIKGGPTITSKAENLKDGSVGLFPTKLFQPIHTYTVKPVSTIWPQKTGVNPETLMQNPGHSKKGTRELNRSENSELLRRQTSNERNETEELPIQKKELKSAIQSVLIDHLAKYQKVRSKALYISSIGKKEEGDSDTDNEERNEKNEKKKIPARLDSPEKTVPLTAIKSPTHLKNNFKSFYYSPKRKLRDEIETKETEINFSLIVSGVQKPLDDALIKLKSKSNLQSFRQAATLGDTKNWLLDTLALKDLRDDTKGPFYSSGFRPISVMNHKRKRLIEKINNYLEHQSREAQTELTQEIHYTQESNQTRIKSEGEEVMMENRSENHISGPAGVRFLVKKGQAYKLTNKGHVRVQSLKLTEKDRKEDYFTKNLEIYKDFLMRINFSFRVIVKSPDIKTYPCYKYYVGQGNNQILIKALMRQRWWWSQTDNKDANDLNFIWTQIKQNKFIESLKMKRKTLDIGNDNISTQVDPLTIGSFSDSNDTDYEIESSMTTSIMLKKKKSDLAKIIGGISEEERARKMKIEESPTKEGYETLFTSTENYLMKRKSSQKISMEDYEDLYRQKKGCTLQMINDPSTLKMCNHIENSFHLGNKKALLWNMRSYYESLKENVFDHLPLTFHIQTGVEDPEFQKFLEVYRKREAEANLEENEKGGKIKSGNNVWIVKPGEETNRGRGIYVCSDLEQIKEIVSANELIFNGVKRTYLVQEYMTKPLLYNKRKFDIRCYFLISCINGIYKGYWYQEGYVRTASKEFNLKNLPNKQIHLTNDAVQKKFDDYGRYENGNKLSFADFNKYLENQEGNASFYSVIYPQLRALGTDAIKAVYGKVDPNKREHYFEVFGLDFMIDTDLKVWLIEINTNPDITTTSPVLTKIIPNMIDNAFKIALDPMFPPPSWLSSKKHLVPENLIENNKFELVFDELEDGPALRSVLKPDNAAMGLIFEMEGEEEDAQE